MVFSRRRMLPLLFIICCAVIAAGTIWTLRSKAGLPPDSWVCRNGVWVMNGNPRYPKPDLPCFGSSDGVKTAFNPRSRTFDPKDVVESFYGWYMSYSEPLTDNAFKDRPELADEFKIQLEQLMATASGTTNPFLDNSQNPVGLFVGEPVIDGDFARVPLSENYSGVQQQLMVSLVMIDGIWKITGVSSSGYGIKLAGTNEKQIQIYFPNSKLKPGNLNCGSITGVSRTLGRISTVTDVLNQLFSGPSVTERAMGYVSTFSDKTAGILKSVKITGNTAYVNLKDIRRLTPDLVTVCGRTRFFTQIRETLKSYANVTDVIYAIDGDPGKFYNWVGLGCTPENFHCDKAPFQ